MNEPSPNEAVELTGSVRHNPRSLWKSAASTIAMNGCNDVGQAHPFTRSAVLLTMEYEGTQVAIGSGVLASYIDGLHYLITARHNLSGKKPGSDTPISSNGGLPNQLRVEGCNVDFSANLYSGDNNPNVDIALYATHSRGSVIDVTVFQVPPGTRVNYPLHSSFLIPRTNSQLPLYVGRQCYVLGFPEGLIHRPFEDATFPIWETGTSQASRSSISTVSQWEC